MYLNTFMMKKLVSTLAVCVLFVGTLAAQELANFSFGRTPLVSPEMTQDSVTFRLNANYATVVNLYGSWLAGYTATIPLAKGPDGVWKVTIAKPAPEIYTYNFIVDGVSVNDPTNVYVQRDGTRYLSMLLVDGPLTDNYKEATKRGTVRYMWYDSQSLGISRRMTVYTPYGYETNTKQKYPVLYLLHGGGGDEEAWVSMGRAIQILDNLIEQGKAVPMIVVMPNGNPGQQAARTLGLAEAAINFRDPAFANAYVKSLVTEIVPFIEKNFRAIPKPDSRAIAGLSMGGGHTTSATILYPGTFSYICPLSCGIRDNEQLDAQLQGIKKAGYKLYWVGCGNEDFTYEATKFLDQALTRNQMEHTMYINGGGHTWSNWRIYLNNFAPLLFK